MELITQAVLVHAIGDVNAMNRAQKVQLADEIFLHQPQLLASILVLANMGVSTVTFRHKGASCFRHIGASSKRSN